MYRKCFCVLLWNVYQAYPEESFIYNVSTSTFIHVNQVYNVYLNLSTIFRYRYVNTHIKEQ